MSLAGDYLDIEPTLTATGSIDSGDAGAGAVLSGSTIDLRPATAVRYHRCLAWGGGNVFHESATQSLTWAVALQTRAALTGTGSTWAAYATASDPTAKTVTGTASGVSNDCAKGYYNLRSASRYLRVRVTPTCSTTATGLIYHAQGGVVLIPDKLPPAA